MYLLCLIFILKHTHRVQIELDPERLPLDDPKTFALLSCGDTSGVFQLEAGGLQSLCRQFGVESMEHIIALLAVYHPGPMEFIPCLIARKHGEEKIEYDHPKLEPILRETYGILLYQEQVLELLHALAGFTPGRAELVRRAIGKRKTTEMERDRKEFLQGCAKTSAIPPEDAEKLWEKLCRFAIYAFNKAHSAAYALLAYRTAYLKANYPQEFFAALLCRVEKNSEDFSSLLDECRKQGIALLPPDVNAGNLLFSAEGEAIRVGLVAIHGLKKSVCQAIQAVRKKGGVFVSPLDFLERAGECVNRKSLEALIRSGALDSLGVGRSRLFAVMEEAVACAEERRKNRESGQGTLFESAAAGNGLFDDLPLPDIPEWEEAKLRADEKQFLGFNLPDFSSVASAILSSGAGEEFRRERDSAESRGTEEVAERSSEKTACRMELFISETQCSSRFFEDLKTVLRNHSGRVPVLFFVKTEKGPVAGIEIAQTFYVTPSMELTADLEKLLGGGCCRMAESSVSSDSVSGAAFSSPPAKRKGVDLP